MTTSAGAAAGAALGARTARSCDGCMRRRARWHCPADDAFLCQTCDVSVHSANPLARRHHRVRLPSASCSSPPCDPDAPTWLHGLKRRPRTPRSKPGGGKHEATTPNSMAAAASAAVPDLEAEESGSGIVGDNDDHGFLVDDDEDLLYRVPVLLQPFSAECVQDGYFEFGGQKIPCRVLAKIDRSQVEGGYLYTFHAPDRKVAEDDALLKQYYFEIFQIACLDVIRDWLQGYLGRK